MRWLALLAFLGGCDVVFRLDHVAGPDASADAPMPTGRWTQVEAGQFVTCAIDDAKHLWCFGRNVAGEAGVGSTAAQIVSRRRSTIRRGR